ncbi:unnamed protein product, partial [Callosobruchus maculatus]
HVEHIERDSLNSSPNLSSCTGCVKQSIVNTELKEIMPAFIQHSKDWKQKLMLFKVAD